VFLVDTREGRPETARERRNRLAREKRIRANVAFWEAVERDEIELDEPIQETVIMADPFVGRDDVGKRRRRRQAAYERGW